MPNRRPSSRRTVLLPILAAVLALAVGAGGFLAALAATFTDQAQVGGNTFSTGTWVTGMRLATGTYTGNAADNRVITGVGFQPDVVFVKCTCGVSAVVRTSTMSGDATKVIGTLTALQPDHVQSLDADGFTIGTSTRVNTNSNTYHWVAMKAGTDLRVGSYVGDGTDDRSITGVGFQPVWVVTMGDGDDSWIRPASVTGDASYPMDGVSQFTNRIQALEADGFQIGSNANVNELATTFHYIAWKASANVKQATYVGNGTDNRSITGVGFQPLMVWVKRDTNNQATWRPASISGDLSLFWSGTAANSDRIQLLEADGFQVGTDEQVNTTATYHYIALKDGGP
jgi:hypothetical protein